MNITKKSLAYMDHCYAVSVLNQNQEILFATEAQGGCTGYNAYGEQPFSVFDGPGGVMSMVEIPHSGGDFLAIQNFFPTFRSEKAALVWLHRKADGSFAPEHFLELPYIHRFDLIDLNGTVHLIACTLCESKQFTDDWSSPGKVYAGVLPARASDGIKLSVLLEPLTRNHGYCRGTLGGRIVCLVSGDEGVFALYPPSSSEKWEIAHLLTEPTGDIALADIDGDGAEEIAAIQPFHGTHFSVYHREQDGFLRTYHKEINFGHALWGGVLCGSPAFICGCRGGAMELLCLRYELGRYALEEIDVGGGPSNVSVLHRTDGVDVLCSANRQAGEAAIYLLTV